MAFLPLSHLSDLPLSNLSDLPLKKPHRTVKSVRFAPVRDARDEIHANPSLNRVMTESNAEFLSRDPVTTLSGAVPVLRAEL